MKLASRRCRAFTLLEVLLASLIAILLLSALYFAMDITLRQTQQSRDNVDVDNLARGVFARLNMDLASSLAPLPPKSGGNAAPSTSSSSGDSSSTTSTTTGNASAVVPTGAGTVAPTPDPSTTTTTTVTTTVTMTGDATAAPQIADVGFQAGIMGTDKQLTVFHSRVPLALTTVDGLDAATSSASDAATPSDLYRVTYWMSQGSGLCRQERPWVTADGIRDSADPDYSTEATDVLVPEVTDATFEYFDGANWQSSWNPDGSTMSDDGVTPIGPPRAVRVTLNFSFPSSRPNGSAYETTLVKVIPVRAAPGTLTPTMIAPSTDTGSDSSGASATTTASSGTSGNPSSGAATAAMSAPAAPAASGAKGGGR